MLIIPLHKPLNAKTFPWVTAALILANVFVFAFLQSGDDAVAERAAAYYRASGLVEVELPRLVAHLRAAPESEDRDQLADWLEAAREPGRSALAVEAAQSDEAFLAMLAKDPPFAGDADQQQRWREQRARIDALWADRFSERYMMRYEHFEPGRILSSMFLHAGFGHLFGNMLFLALLGLLVEGALGPGLFLALYLAAGFGGGALSVLRHYGDAGAGLGASGAIAGLMGAYTVLWGLRKVRFFWWFFVLFDYVKAPALILLPMWLGWELFNMWTQPNAHVAFDVHAGGIACGALLAWGVRARGLERREFLDEEEQRERHEGRLAEAMSALGRLEFGRARSALEPLLAERPDDFRVLVPWFRAWRDRPGDDAFHDAARRVVLKPAPRREDLATQLGVFGDYVAASGGKPRMAPVERAALARRWIAAGALAEAEKALAIQPDVAADAEDIADGWLVLARALRERGDAKAADATLRQLMTRHPGAAAAGKARFLLEQAAG